MTVLKFKKLEYSYQTGKKKSIGSWGKNDGISGV